MSQAPDDDDSDVINLFKRGSDDDFDSTEWIDALLTRAIQSPGPRMRSAVASPTTVDDAEKERRKALLVAILTRSLQRLEEWMSEFANKPDVNFTVGRDRYTPLMLAAMRGDMEVVRILVERLKANKHAKTYRGDKSAADLAEDEEIKRYLSA
ncbi:hypothetical protein GUITHDRAFT_163268 [Guillardia theta CCMP2712]|uniref:Uncharacterized protein n=1 Tax=Guillardia theta (strain CCMP2712) TaxID=905079 RepID=L1JBC1_GUITC|nr:hypothetical protein GUITHDRAFT_163268 [Guillardia theta CCMP2712]EKX45390.1 hypothetical protein GUITHDRAFT_163268 [Guillardia theta CCMP2712]|mmetsp:Transcript_49400/g.154917  ORF Transcript_49400/g.154917 Transcript_49400/m.154917 type:complete len:153 (-) Transcript_49400:1852-2310(-)|eukprot:XP_005832370.1 hypothetical protein GUITHDRAFT_163268 [Guillardia theta CCMP2712]